jgi:succinyl-CoA synthetase beta subunit
MDLLEYQAKELFRRAGIPILPSQRIDHPTQLRHLEIAYPIALKSQVRKSGRAKVGGVRFVDNTIDAIAIAQTLFGLPIHGELPTALLAEVKYHTREEYYLAILLDRSARRPVLLGSCCGGTRIEDQPHSIHQVWVDQTFSPYYARHLALKMGLEGSLLLRVASVVEKMYRIFVESDLDVIEINPLGIAADQEVMALDGKVIVNPDAVQRHPDLLEFCLQTATDITTVRELADRGSDLTTIARVVGMQWVELAGGSVAVLCNGAGLTLATMDLLSQVDCLPANFLDIGETAGGVQIQQGLMLLHLFLLRQPAAAIPVILINLLGSLATCEEVAEIVLQFQRDHLCQLSSPPRLVVRTVESSLLSSFASAQTRLAAAGIPLCADLDEAIALCQHPRQEPLNEPVKERLRPRRVSANRSVSAERKPLRRSV